MQPFVFTSDVASLKVEGARVLDIPSDSTNKTALLNWYAQALGVPEYFGANWDAFEECLRDLSWINEYRVVLYHQTVPLGSSPHDQRVYVEILASTVRDWRPGEEHELIAAFDPACELKLRAATRVR